MEEPNESFIIKYVKGELNEDEALVVENWIDRSPENRKVVAQLAYIYHAANTEKRMLNRDAYGAFERVQEKTQRRNRLHLRQQIAVAASILIGIMGMIYFSLPKKTVPPSMVTISSDKYLRKAFTLPDGTMVWLNAGSNLSYSSSWSNERQVTLHGEAYFKVAQDAKKPFVVTAGKSIDIEVLGTEFNVTAYDEEAIVQTTLISGSVALRLPENRSKTILRPSEKAVYSKDRKELKVAAIVTQRETDWMQHRLVFRDTPMKEVLSRLAHFYNVEFAVKDDQINTYTFTGIFQDRPLSQVLDYMKIASNIHYTIHHPSNKSESKPMINLTKQK